ncbi:hypothetical protein ACT4YX_07940 [Acinetobacter baumannii]|nr:hypothetical protein [Acinetobacter baumannii]MCZ3200711.1 hypothetical protein [Acinetobacter baumannii]MDC4331140.1 hypothetical protein [Acinetobacter baumannii]MDC4616560.1 hypothetical protein [Acinetobacter baumannii]MDC5152611.1 hypothetical protein [Acinetobacter baumannii]MDC5530583.1 hypothetical protein [Acinetobacter baumannii]
MSGVPAGRAKIQYGEDQSKDEFPALEVDDWFTQLGSSTKTGKEE